MWWGLQRRRDVVDHAVNWNVLGRSEFDMYLDSFFLGTLGRVSEIGYVPDMYSLVNASTNR
jgi:hypothetical protein